MVLKNRNGFKKSRCDPQMELDLESGNEMELGIKFDLIFKMEFESKVWILNRVEIQDETLKSGSRFPNGNWI
jgi:hypothetical protein